MVYQISGSKTYGMFPAQTLLRKGLNEHILNGMRTILHAETQSDRPPISLPIGSDDLIIHAKLYALADKYIVSGLKDAVLAKFGDCANESFKGDKFYQAAKIVFTRTPDTCASLREIIAAHVHEEKHTYRLEHNDDLEKAWEEILGLAHWIRLHEDTGSVGET